MFGRLWEALQRLSEEEVEKLTDSHFAIEIHIVRKRIKNNIELNSIDTNVDRAIETLALFPTRTEAMNFLKEKFPTRKDIELIARRLDIPIVRQDTIKVLQEKVVESTVGARLRSKAIQGNQS